MHVYSRIMEVNKEICNITIPDEYQDNAPIAHYIIDFEQEEFVDYHMSAIHTSGLHIQNIKIRTFDKIAIDFTTTGQHIRFFFNFKGSTNVKNGAGNQSYSHDVGMLQRNFLHNYGADGIVHIDEGDEAIHVILKMSSDFYINLLRGESWINDDAFHQYILAGKPENRPNETLYMDQKVFNILQEIITCQSIENNQFYFLILKLRELLFTIHQITSFGVKTDDKRMLSLEILEKVRGYLLGNLDNPPNVNVLSRKFMLNEKKLKKEFKLAYGHTIYAFVIQERMQKAKKLVLEDHNVNELAFMLGYQSVSHFIKVFKTYHGVTPKEAIKQFKAIVSNSTKGVSICLTSLFSSLLYEQLPSYCIRLFTEIPPAYLL